MIKKIGLSLLLVFGIMSCVWAVGEPGAPPLRFAAQAQAKAADSQSDAMEFARQAGTVAGFAQACGQDTADLTKRTEEAVNKLTDNPTDRTAAMLVYQQLAREAQASERKTQRMSCNKILQDYHSLPILQPDYKEKVIAQLKPS